MQDRHLHVYKKHILESGNEFILKPSRRIKKFLTVILGNPQWGSSLEYSDSLKPTQSHVPGFGVFTSCTEDQINTQCPTDLDH